MMSNKKLCGGILDSKNYRKALALLRACGIQYKDVGFGFDRYYWYNGLYRVSGGKVFLIYAMNIVLPYTGDSIDCRESVYSKRLGL